MFSRTGGHRRVVSTKSIAYLYSSHLKSLKWRTLCIPSDFVPVSMPMMIIEITIVWSSSMITRTSARPVKDQNSVHVEMTELVASSELGTTLIVFSNQKSFRIREDHEKNFLTPWDVGTRTKLLKHLGLFTNQSTKINYFKVERWFSRTVRRGTVTERSKLTMQ